VLTASGSGALTVKNAISAASVNDSEATTLNGSAVTVTTTGAQTYNGAITLGNDATLTSSGGGSIAFGSAVDGAQALTINNPGGTTTFSGLVGNATPLTSLTVDGGHLGTINGIKVSKTLTLTAISGDITEAGTASIQAGTLTASAGGSIVLGNTGTRSGSGQPLNQIDAINGMTAGGGIYVYDAPQAANTLGTLTLSGTIKANGDATIRTGRKLVLANGLSINPGANHDIILSAEGTLTPNTGLKDFFVNGTTSANPLHVSGNNGRWFVYLPFSNTAGIPSLGNLVGGVVAGGVDFETFDATKGNLPSGFILEQGVPKANATQIFSILFYEVPFQDYRRVTLAISEDTDPSKFCTVNAVCSSGYDILRKEAESKRAEGAAARKVGETLFVIHPVEHAMR